MTRLTTVAEPQVRVHGRIPAYQVGYAREKVSAVLRLAARPVLFVRLSLDRAAGPGVERPYTIRVYVDVNGVDVHARASAPTFTEAVDLVQRRLRTLLGREPRRR